MIRPFLLRFQEPVMNDEDTSAANCGTQTFTRVNGEQCDPDAPLGHSLAGGRALERGTMTKTAVKAEQPDDDRDLYSLRAVPKISTLRTKARSRTPDVFS